MADMVGFLTALDGRWGRAARKAKNFVADVLKLKNDYRSEKEIIDDLEKWKNALQRYNIVNHSEVEYGHARLDAFGRIYNRVVQYAISKTSLSRSWRWSFFPPESRARRC